jgi:hypothetical protein
MTARWKRLKASESVSDVARQPAGDLIENKPGGPDPLIDGTWRSAVRQEFLRSMARKNSKC